MDSEAPRSPNFFVLQHAVDSRYDTLFSICEPFNLADAPRCPQCGDPLGMLTWLPPYRVDLKLHGEEPGDLVEGPGYELLISERFSKAFRAEGLTGLSGFHPVEVLRVRSGKRRAHKPTSMPRYEVVSICFSRATVDVTLNRVRICEPITCKQCLSTGIDAINGFVLEPGTWGGEDIFRPRGMLGKILVSERFKDFVELHGLTNMVLTPTEQYVWDPSNLGPAPLPTA